MKNLAWVLGAAALVWCAVLTWGGGASSTPALEGGARAVVAFVHGDSLQQGYGLIADLDQILGRQVAAIEEQLRVKAQPLQEEAMELIEYAQNGNPTNSELNVARERMAEIENELNVYQAQAERAAANREQSMQNMIAQTLRDEIATYAEEAGIDVVLNWGLSGEGVLYGGQGFDVTGPLLAYLNERHEAKKAERRAELEAERDSANAE
jgi:Skp family chaperone for outer membrane proteins